VIFIPSEETIEIRKVGHVVGEREDSPTLNPRSSLSSKIQSLIVSQYLTPEQIHYLGVNELTQSIVFSDIVVGSKPTVFSNGMYLFVGFDNQAYLEVIDLATYTLFTTITITTGSVFSIVSDGTHLYCCGNTGVISKVNIDSLSEVSTLALGISVFSLFVDGTYLYAGGELSNSFKRINLSDFTTITSLNVTDAGIYSIIGDSNYIYITHYLSPAKIRKIRRDTFTIESVLVLAAGEDNAASILKNGSYLYVGLDQKISKIDLDSFTKITTLTLSPGPGGGNTLVTYLSADNKYIFAGMSTLPGTVVVIDIATFVELSLITSGLTGQISSLNSDGLYLYIGEESASPILTRQYIIPAVSSNDKKINTIYNSLLSSVYGLSALESLVDDLETRLTTTRAAYLDNLTGTTATGTYSHANNTNEQDVLEFAASKQKVDLYLDMVNITQTITIREYIKVDGATYRQLSEKVYTTDFDTNTKAISISFEQPNRAYKITLQSGTAEGSAKNIPYAYITLPRT